MSDTESEATEVGLPNMLTSKRLSEGTGIPETTLCNWRYLGKGPRSIKLGRNVRYLESDVLAWIEEQQQADPHGTVDVP